MYLLVYSINIGVLLLLNTLKDISIYFMLLVLGGLPPFLGFYPKLYILRTLISNYPSLIFRLLVTSILTLLYYTRILVANLLRTPNWGKSSILTLFTLLGSIGLIPMLNDQSSFIVTAYLCSRLNKVVGLMPRKCVPCNQWIIA